MASVRKTIKTLVWDQRKSDSRYIDIRFLSITHMITDQIGLHSVLLSGAIIIAAKYHGEIVGIL